MGIPSSGNPPTPPAAPPRLLAARRRRAAAPAAAGAGQPHVDVDDDELEEGAEIWSWWGAPRMALILEAMVGCSRMTLLLEAIMGCSVAPPMALIPEDQRHLGSQEDVPVFFFECLLDLD
eukprot:gene12080-biopygen1333